MTDELARERWLDISGTGFAAALWSTTWHEAIEFRFEATPIGAGSTAL